MRKITIFFLALSLFVAAPATAATNDEWVKLPKPAKGFADGNKVAPSKGFADGNKGEPA